MNEESILEAIKDLLEEIKQLEEKLSKNRFGLEDLIEEARDCFSALEALEAIEEKVKKMKEAKKNEEEKRKYIIDTYSNKEWQCSFCGGYFKGMPKGFLSKEELNEPFCEDCFEVMFQPPPCTLSLDGELHFLKEENE